MKTPIVHSLLCLMLATSCSSNTSNVMWENTKAFGKYLNDKTKGLFEKQSSSDDLIASHDEVMPPYNDEFIPLQDEDLRPQYTELAAPQAKQTPDLKIEKFKNPSHHLASIFKMVHFNTDDEKLRVKEYFQTISRISEYMKKNQGTYIFVEGHCDYRGSESHNQALGSRRANYIRNQLIKSGVGPDQIFTISFGKDKPLAKGTSRPALAKNRRVEFKIYDPTTTSVR